MTFPPPAARTAAAVSPRRILVVEDDPEAAHFFRHVLTASGRFHVTHTADPGIALALVATEPWDLVLTDFELPVMSGLDLVANLRRMTPAVPVIVVTAHSPEADPVTTGGCRPDQILRKPVRPTVLLAAVIALTTPR